MVTRIALVLIVTLTFLTGCLLHQLPINSLEKNSREKSKNFDINNKYDQVNYNPTNFKLPDKQEDQGIVTSKGFKNSPEIHKLYLKYLKTGEHYGIKREGIRTLPYSAYEAPLLECATLQLCDIILEKGELINSINLGDPTRWQVKASYIGDQKQGNGSSVIEFKPTQINIATTVRIFTNKRIYRLGLVSRPETIAQTINFWYPEDTLDHLTIQAQIQHNKQLNQSQSILSRYSIKLDHLNSDYNYSSPNQSKPAWMPETVFDDGSKTFIRLPSNSPIIPVFFVTKNEKKLLTNYIYEEPYIIYQGTFKEGVLISGKASQQQKINIFNKAWN